MSNRVEKLRFWLVGSAVFLVLVIVAFVGSARYLRHRLSRLQERLGVNIVRETNGYTYTQSMQGRTVYRIHASKAVEHADGKVALHDVSIVLYGKKGDRSDRIYGDEFEYDQKAGVVRATGLVHIDLQTAGAAGQATREHSSLKVMHVTTSGLVYLQKLGVAATSEPIEFEAGGISGHATGADYTSDSGLLTLHSAVNMSGTSGGHPLAVTAATAQFNDRNQVVILTYANYESEGRTAAANQATLHRRTDGTLSRVEALGDVTTEAKRATMVSQHADIALGATSQPQTALLTGGVKYTSSQTLRQVKAQAEQLTISFDGQAKPQPERAIFTGSVHMTERTRAADAAKATWYTRDLTAARVEASLVLGGSGKSELRNARSTGNPHLTITSGDSLASSRSVVTTDLSADELSAQMNAASDAKQPQLDTIVGRGHTVLHQLTADGIEQTSTGDSLDAKFRPKEAWSATKAGLALPETSQFADALLSEVQQGHVTMTRRVPAQSQNKVGTKAGQAASGDDVQHAMADRAAYDGDLDRITLTGSVQMGDAGSRLWANQVVLDRKTGDAHATGSVKMNDGNGASAPLAGVARTGPAQTRNQAPVNSSQRAAQIEPTHILADRAELDHATETATFYGKPVRLWQGGDQIQAPVIEFVKVQKRLVARGNAGTDGSAQALVHTVFTGSPNEATGATKQAAAKSGAAGTPCDTKAATKPGTHATGTDTPSPSIVQIASGGLTYSGILRQADFTGGFRADTVDGTIRAGEGSVYLNQTARVSGPVAPTNDSAEIASPSGASLAGGVDRVVATGHVELIKPGMKASGERLIYTASDHIALLTGTKEAPPKAVGPQGTTTGAALRFQTSCDGSGGGTVEVLGAPGQRVLTDARISDDGKREKGKR